MELIDQMMWNGTEIRNFLFFFPFFENLKFLFLFSLCLLIGESKRFN